MAPQKILLPYNFSAMDQKSLDFLIHNFASNPENEITLLHTYTPLPQVDTDGSTVMGKLRSRIQFLATEVRKKEDELKDVQNHLISQGFQAGKVDYIFRERTKDMADEIIDTVKNGAYTIIIISYMPERVTRLFVRSAHEKLVSSCKDVAICIVT